MTVSQLIEKLQKLEFPEQDILISDDGLLFVELKIVPLEGDHAALLHHGIDVGILDSDCYCLIAKEGYSNLQDKEDTK